jgi:hypothetical protein
MKSKPSPESDWRAFTPDQRDNEDVILEIKHRTVALWAGIVAMVCMTCVVVKYYRDNPLQATAVEAKAGN